MRKAVATMEKRLSRGLDVLLGKHGSSKGSSEEIAEIPLTAVRPNPFQPRAEFEASAIDELASSIETCGLIQPVIVREVSQGVFELIAGERRFRAFQKLGRKSIPAIVRTVSEHDQVLFALVENLQRRDLNAIEEAIAFDRLLTEHGLTHEQVASKVGRSRSAISNQLRLLELPPIARDAVSRGTLSPGHARALVPLGARPDFPTILDRVINDQLSVRETEVLARAQAGESESLDASGEAPNRKAIKDPSSERAAIEADIETRLRAHWGVVVRARWNGRGGEITLKASSLPELDYLVRRLEQARWPQTIDNDELESLTNGE
jgi:ParB family transcriptional regulator, chromosome partitioning protein